jgi:hypothetical protein
MREGGYAFDAWSPKQGLQRGYTYRRIEDAHYARKFEFRCRDEVCPDDIVACNTLDEFVRSTIGADLREPYASFSDGRPRHVLHVEKRAADH